MLLGGLLIIPLLGAILIAAMPARHAKWIALGATTITLIYSLVLALIFRHWYDGGFGMEASAEWLPEFGVRVDLGVDTVSMLLVLLTTILMPLCVLGSFSAINDRIKEYYGWLVALEAAMIGVFVARDLIFFYVCFEFTLVPMYFLIAIYGAENRARAATKFFIYTFTGSLIALAGLVYVAWQYSLTNAGEWSFSIAALTQFASGMSMKEQSLVLLALMAGFAVKVPLFPLHTWLPLAHTEAPAAGSVILAAVLLKLGTYGLYRFVLPMVPDAVVEYAPLIAVIAIIGIIYAALICWVQNDVKRLVAYSSVSHLGFCVLGLFALNPLGVQGSILYMINHGLSTGALFFLIGMVYERYHTRDMDQMGGLSKRMPVWAFFAVFFTMASVGLPGLNGFVSEFLCLIGAFTASADASPYPGLLGPWYGAVAGVGMILTAMYLLMMVGKVVFGPLKEPSVGSGHGEHKRPVDLSLREVVVLAPLAVLCLVLGIYPRPVLETLDHSVELVLAEYPQRIEAYHLRQEAMLAARAGRKAVAEKLWFLIPEMWLFAGAVLVSLMGLSHRKGVRASLPLATCVVLLIAGLITPWVYGSERGVLAIGEADLLMPVLGRYVKMVVCAVGIILALISAGLIDRKLEAAVEAGRARFDPIRSNQGEFYAFFLLSLVGVMLCCNANDLIWLFLALELTSLPTYIMVAMSRGSGRAQEAGVKYFFLGALSAATFLYGFSLLYGATGTVVLTEMQTVFADQGMSTIALIGMILALLGISFKIAAVPMHFYAADVYEGAASPVTAFLGFVPKAAGMIAIILLLGTVGWGEDGLPRPIATMLWMVAVLTMTLGNVGALLQRSVKRMLAYSSIAHSGYMLIGVIAGPGLGINAVLFYLLAYGIMNSAAFAVLAGLERRGQELESMDDLAGLRHRHPGMAAVMAISAGSLLGVPPLLGFVGKLYLFMAGIQAGQLPLVVIAGLNSAISAWYYLRLVGLPILYKPTAQSETIVRSPAIWPRVAGIATSAALVLLPFWSQPMLKASAKATDMYRSTLHEKQGSDEATERRSDEGLRSRELSLDPRADAGRAGDVSP